MTIVRISRLHQAVFHSACHTSLSISEVHIWLKRIFLNLARGSAPVIDVYRTRADLITGLSLKDYLGRFDGVNYCQAPFDEIYSAITDGVDKSTATETQEFLIEHVAGKDVWQFSNAQAEWRERKLEPVNNSV